MLFNLLKTLHSPGGARPQYLSNRLNTLFAFNTFKNTIPALDQVLYFSGSAGNQHNWTVGPLILAVQITASVSMVYD